MTDMFRLRVLWGGSGVVGGGVSTFFFDSGATASAITPAINTFFTAIKGNVPNTVTWTIPNGGDLITEDTGILTGAWTSGGAYTIVATGTNQWASGVGGRINWHTGSVINHRRVRGSTFIAPLSNNLFDTDGTLNNTMVTAVNTACANLVATTGVLLGVWHRPHPKGSSNGALALVTSGTMPDQVSWLRTRRT
jgi:hypothetical protein